MSFAPFSRRRLIRAAVIAGPGVMLLGRNGRATPSGRETDIVRLGWGFGGLPLLAKERGEFAKLLAKDGIKTEWVGPFPNHAPSIQAVTGNSSDFSFGGSTTPALAAIIAGSPLVFTQFSTVSPRTTAIIAREGINSVKDLVGKTVAVNRSGVAEFLLVAALEKNNVDRSKVKVVYLNPPEAAPAFGSGQVDAWAMWSPGVDIARDEYKGHDIFVEGRDLGFQIDFGSWLARREWTLKNPALVKAVNAAFVAEAKWASDHPTEAETIAQKVGKYSDQIRDLFISQHRKYTIRPVTDLAFQQEFQTAADWLAVRKVLPEKLTITDYLVAPA